MLSRQRAAFLLRDQAHHCATMGSALYGHLLEHAAEDAEGGGPAYAALAPHDAPNLRGDALALRLMAAVHRLVLTGRAPGLAAHYPSVGGRTGRPGAWDEFRAVLVEQADRISPLVALPCQTNEVGRCAPLAIAFLALASETGLPLRLLEVGASAGLNLRFDHYRYAAGGTTWGPKASPVDLSGLWLQSPRLPDALAVAERSGCDLRPVDPLSAEGRLGLEASVWADQEERLARLRGALAVAALVPVRVERASVESWLGDHLGDPVPGMVTVVFHSIVEEYLPSRVRTAFEATLAEAGSRASADAPLAWVRLEPQPSTLRYVVTLTSWPEGRESALATSGAHGAGVRLLS